MSDIISKIGRYVCNFEGYVRTKSPILLQGTAAQGYGEGFGDLKLGFDLRG